MTLYTLDQVTAIAKGAGLSEYNARIAGALAFCESPVMRDSKVWANSEAIGDLDKVDSTWGPSYGLWQIRSLKAAKPGDIRYGPSLKADVAYQARSMKYIMETQGFQAWTTFRTGQYKAYLQEEFPPAPGTHVVVYGDTYWDLGKKYGIDWKVLAAQNQNKPLQIGMVLQLPYRIYRVVQGDTLYGIYRKTGVHWTVIAQLNGLTEPYKIYPGQVLKLPEG